MLREALLALGGSFSFPCQTDLSLGGTPPTISIGNCGLRLPKNRYFKTKLPWNSQFCHPTRLSR
jgi:hypothetical protein